MKTKPYIGAIACTVLILAACAGPTRQQQGTGTGAAIGAGIGAILGQAIGRSTEGTLIGASLGAMVGGVTGNQVGAYMDRQEQELRQAMAASEATGRQQEARQQVAMVERTNDVLTATFRSELLFDFNSAAIKPGGITELVRVATILNKYPDTHIRVEGHTDKVGSDAYNQQLSIRRAEAARDVLVASGVKPERIETAGFGKTRLISSEDALNRRVNIVIKPIAKG